MTRKEFESYLYDWFNEGRWYRENYDTVVQGYAHNDLCKLLSKLMGLDAHFWEESWMPNAKDNKP